MTFILFCHYYFEICVKMYNLYTNEERVFIIKSFYGGNSYRRVRDLFSIKFINRHIPSVSTISKLVQKFERTANVSTKSIPVPANENINRPEHDLLEERILAMINLDPSSSIRRIANELDCTSTFVYKVLKKHGYYSYKIQRHQELFPFDEENRIVFCEEMQNRANTDRTFLSRICFTDECTFTLNNEPNVQNTRYWAVDNPRKSVSTRTQYPQKINLWAGIFGHHIIGPFEIGGNLNTENYLDLLQNEIGPAIDNVAHPEQEVWFQHDGCPAHNGRRVKEFLDLAFPERWIGRGGAINWPARSPDLTPCDFYLWGHLKSQIYKIRHQNLQSLRDAIFNECLRITPRTLFNVRSSFYNRLGYCLAQNGTVFEYLL